MRFSIITVNFNASSGLQRTIESVLRQNYPDYEYIIIDGGSTDGSVDVINQYSDRIAFWVSEKDSGIYNAMNKGVSHANGEYVLFMNSGDTFASDDVLKEVSHCLDADIICGNALLSGGERWNAPDYLDEKFLLNRFSICHQSTFIRTRILKEKPYCEDFRIVADYLSLVYELLVNKRTYRRVDIVVCNYECNGVSSDDRQADDEKIRALDYLRYNGLLEEDRLVAMCKSLKPIGRKYKLAYALFRLLSK